MKQTKAPTITPSKAYTTVLVLSILLVGQIFGVAVYQLKTDSTTAALTAVAGDEFIMAVQSKTKVVAITKYGKIYAKQATSGGMSEVVDIYNGLRPTMPTKDFKGSIDCWGTEDKCVICGIGGCYTFKWQSGPTGNVITFDQRYFHQKFMFSPNGNTQSNYFDYVFKVMTLGNTNYFLALESMKASNSAGLVRYNSAQGSQNCYKQFSPNFSENDTTHKYHMALFSMTKLVGVINESSRRLYLIDYTQVSGALKSFVMTGSQNVGPLFNYQAQPDTNKVVICSHVNPLQICAEYVYSGPALVAGRTYTCPDTTSATFITVAHVPNSSRFLVIKHDKMYVYLGQPTGTTPTAPQGSTSGEIPLTETILNIKDGFFYPKLVVMAKNMVYLTEIMATADIPSSHCSHACATSTSCNPAIRNTVCTGTGCGTAISNTVITAGNSNPLKCSLSSLSGPGLTSIFGGYATSPETANIQSGGDFCFNSTYTGVGSYSTNPNLKLTKKPTSSSSGMNGWWYVLIIGGGLLLTGGVIAAVTAGGGKAKKTQMMMHQQRMYQMGGQNGMRGNMGNQFGNQMGNMNNGGNMNRRSMDISNMSQGMDPGMQGGNMNHTGGFEMQEMGNQMGNNRMNNQMNNNQMDNQMDQQFDSSQHFDEVVEEIYDNDFNNQMGGNDMGMDNGMGENIGNNMRRRPSDMMFSGNEHPSNSLGTYGNRR